MIIDHSTIMKQFLLVFFLFFQFSGLFAQLEPQYFGTYKNEEGTAAYTVYTMDEVVSDCFVVEYVEYENGDVVFASTGFGHCEGEEGHLTILLDDRKDPIEVGFEMYDDGTKIMKVFQEDGSVIAFYPYSGDDLSSGVSGEEIYYMREDGSELILIPGSENKTIDFGIYYNVENEVCSKNQIETYMSAGNEEQTVYYSILEGSCKLTFYFSTDSIEIKEEGCTTYHGRNCGEWSGLYILNR